MPRTIGSTGGIAGLALAFAILCLVACAQRQRTEKLPERLARLIEEVRNGDNWDNAWSWEGGPAPALVEIGGAALEPLCQQLDRETELPAAARLCHVLGELGDRSALPSILRFINRDLDREQKRQIDLASRTSIPFGSEWNRWHRYYEGWIVPATVKLADETAFATMVRLHAHAHDGNQLAEPVFGALKKEEAIPLLVPSFCFATLGSAHTEAIRALTAINRPVADSLLASWKELPLNERIKRLRMLTVLADEVRTKNLIQRVRSSFDREASLRVFSLTEDHVRQVHSLANETDRHVRYHLVHLLKQHLEFHPGDSASSEIIEGLKADPDPSVRSATTPEQRSNPARRFIHSRPACFPSRRPPLRRPRRILVSPPEDFGNRSTLSEENKDEISIELALQNPTAKLDTPLYRFNDPIWLRLRILTATGETNDDAIEGRPDPEDRPRSAPPGGRSVTLHIWDDQMNETSHHVYQIGGKMDNYLRTLDNYMRSSKNLLQYPEDAEANDHSLAYVNLIEAAKLEPGKYVIAAAIEGQLTTRVSLMVGSTVTDQVAKPATRTSFNPFGENRFARVKWRTRTGGQSPDVAAVLDENFLYVTAAGVVKALDLRDGTVAWTSSRQTDRLMDLRMIRGQLVIKTARLLDEEKRESVVSKVTLDKSTGRVLEEREIGSLTSPQSSWATYVKADFPHRRELHLGNEGRSFLVGHDGTLALWSGTRIISTLETGTPRWHSASADGRSLYGGALRPRKATVCLDTATGDERWRSEGIDVLGLKRVGDVLCGWSSGYGPMRGLDPQTGVPLWECPMRDHKERWHSFAADGSILYAHSQGGGLWAIEAKTGELLWKLDARLQRSRRLPLAAGNMIYYCGEDGYWYALENQAKL